MSGGSRTPEPRRSWSALLSLIQPDDNLSAVVYGELLTGATIAAAIGEVGSVLELTLIVIGTLAVYWIAHTYADFVALHMQRGGSGPWLIRRTLRRELPMVTACLPPLLVLAVARGLGATDDAACYLALAYITLSLIVYGFRSARLGGLRLYLQVLIALLHGVLGAAIILLKVILH